MFSHRIQPALAAVTVIADTNPTATDILGWLFTIGLAGAVWQGIKHVQKCYRAQEKQDKIEEAAWAIGIPAISAGVYWFSIKIGIMSQLTLGNLPPW